MEYFGNSAFDCSSTTTSNLKLQKTENFNDEIIWNKFNEKTEFKFRDYHSFNSCSSSNLRLKDKSSASSSDSYLKEVDASAEFDLHSNIHQHQSICKYSMTNPVLNNVKPLGIHFDPYCVGKMTGTNSPEYDNLTATEIFDAKSRQQKKYCEISFHSSSDHMNLNTLDYQLLKDSIKFNNNFATYLDTQNDKVAGNFIISCNNVFSKKKFSYFL